MKKDKEKLDSLPALLPGSEYKIDDPDKALRANLLGIAIAVVVHAEKENISQDGRNALLSSFDKKRNKVVSYTKKEIKFNQKHLPRSLCGVTGPSVPGQVKDESLFENKVWSWLQRSLLKNIDWCGLYDLIDTQRSKYGNYPTSWWVRVKNICQRAEITTCQFDPITEILKISEEQVLSKQIRKPQHEHPAQTKPDIPPTKRPGAWNRVKGFFIELYGITIERIIKALLDKYG